MTISIHPVILSGGAGTRLWPVSRESAPKPFMELPDGESLLKKTLLRARRVAGDGSVCMVTNRDYYFRAKDECVAAKAERTSWLLEPFGRNTAAAVLLAALHVRAAHGDDALMLVLPADNLVKDLDAFSRDVEVAAATARQGRLVTFGIPPTRPETGFGYIEVATAPQPGRAGAALRFVEKPDAERAAQYLQAGTFLWNSGMFLFTTGAIVSAFERLSPDVHAAVSSLWERMAAAGGNGGPLEIPADAFATVPDISIDYAVMERSPDVSVVPARFDWSDIGSWLAMADLTAPDAQGNRLPEGTVAVDTHGTYVHASPDRIVATVGVDDLLVVDTPDALLVAHKDRAQQVKDVAARLKAMGHEAAKLHRTVMRPWGSYTVLHEGPRFKIKRIMVRPGHSLSLQMHHHRSEHWIVVEGTAKVVNGERELMVRTDESTYIPAGHRHRLENPGVIPLVMIEVQSGDYLGEDDIVRFDDRYGRA